MDSDEKNKNVYIIDSELDFLLFFCIHVFILLLSL